MIKALARFIGYVFLATTAFVVVCAAAGFIYGTVKRHWNQPPTTVTLPCDTAEFNQDFTPAQREACRQLRNNQPRS